MSRLVWVALATVAVYLTSTSLSTTVAAAELPPQIQHGDHQLVLNGWGTRNRSLVKLYVGGLYLRAKSSEAAQIIAADEPMAIRIEITSRFVSQDKLVASLHEGFYRSTKGAVGAIKQEITQFRRCFVGQISKGDVFELNYAPATGVVVTKNGHRQGVISGLAFKQALFGIWLSDNPADENLKQAMLARELR